MQKQHVLLPAEPTFQLWRLRKRLHRSPKQHCVSLHRETCVNDGKALDWPRLGYDERSWEMSQPVLNEGPLARTPSWWHGGVNRKPTR